MAGKKRPKGQPKIARIRYGIGASSKSMISTCPKCEKTCVLYHLDVIGGTREFRCLRCEHRFKEKYEN